MSQSKIVKSKIKSVGTHISKVSAHDDYLQFSFKLFDQDDKELCPPNFPDGYVQTLMQRLKALSTWTVSDFTGRLNHTIRNHPHDWARTSRPNGFSSLNEELRSNKGWQFCLTANEHGRVHGIIIGKTFYIIWLDRDHKLYP